MPQYYYTGVSVYFYHKIDIIYTIAFIDVFIITC